MLIERGVAGGGDMSSLTSILLFLLFKRSIIKIDKILSTFNYMEKGLREQFLKVYANVPLNMRDEIILLLGDEKRPITWNVAYLEIRENTEASKEILEKLKKMDVI